MKKTLRLTGDAERDIARLISFTEQYLDERLRAAWDVSLAESEARYDTRASIRVRDKKMPRRGNARYMRPHDWMVLWRGRDSSQVHMSKNTTGQGMAMMAKALLTITLLGLRADELGRAAVRAGGNGHKAGGLDV